MKTFRSKRYRFEIDIPEDWSCPPNSFVSRLLGFDKNLNFGGRGGEFLNIQISPLYPEPSLSDTEISFGRYAEDLGYTNVKTSLIQVEGKDHFCARYVMGWTKNDSGLLWHLKDTGKIEPTTEIPEGLELMLKKYCLVFNGIEYAITCTIGTRLEDRKNMFKEKEELYDTIVSTFRLVKR